MAQFTYRKGQGGDRRGLKEEKQEEKYKNFVCAPLQIGIPFERQVRKMRFMWAKVVFFAMFSATGFTQTTEELEPGTTYAMDSSCNPDYQITCHGGHGTPPTADYFTSTCGGYNREFRKQVMWLPQLGYVTVYVHEDSLAFYYFYIDADGVKCYRYVNGDGTLLDEGKYTP